MGAAMRKENVTPSGTPACTKPKNKGIAEQEQNGVTIPRRLARIFPVNSDFPASNFLVFSGEKYVRIMPTKKIINVSNIITFGNSKMKKRKASVRCFPFSRPKTLLTKKSAIGCK